MNLEELKKQQRWLVWEYKGSDKFPSYANGRSRAGENKNNEFTADSMLVDYKTAFNKSEKVGFVTGDGISCIDIDHAIENESIHPIAQEIIDSCDSYTEYSPSLTGAHIICTGDLSTNGAKSLLDGKKPDDGVEFDLYSENQFITFTGKPIKATPSEINPVNSSVAERFSKKPKTKEPVGGKEIESIKEQCTDEEWRRIVRRGLAALDKSCWSIQCEQKGNRKDQINTQSYILAGWVNAGVLSRKKVCKELYEAAKGMEDPLPDNEIKRNIKSGLQAGEPLSIDYLRETDTEKARENRFINIGDPDREYSINQNWLIKGFLPSVGIAGIYGDSFTGKSFIALDLAFSIATGSDWCSRAVKNPGDVIYMAGEDATGINMRAVAYSKFHHIDEAAPLHLLPMPVDLSSGKSVDSFAKEISHAKISPRLIIIDTLATCFGSGDENTAKDMNLFLSGLRKLKDTLNCCVLFVHHTGHKDKERARGSSVLFAALDAEYILKKHNDYLNLTCTKIKNNTTGNHFSESFKIEPVELGIDEDGDPVSYGVAVNTDAINSAMIDFKDLSDMIKITNANQKTALNIIADELPLTEDELRKELRKRSVEQSAAHKVVSGLLKKGALEIDDGVISIADNVVWK